MYIIICLNLQITTNIQVIPEYFDESIYNNSAVGQLEIINQITESFAFLTVGHWLQGHAGEDRKNISGVLHCFLFLEHLVFLSETLYFHIIDHK